jgi:hypothetical protein
MTVEADRITEHTKVADHAAAGVARLARQFGKPFIQALLRSWLRPLQDIEDVAWALFTESLDNAVGAQLDQLGELLVEPRGALVDAAYRVVLRGKVRVTRSLGTAEDLIDAMRVVFGGDGFAFEEQTHATVYLQPFAPLVVDGVEIAWDVLVALLKRAKAAGVRLFLLTPAAGLNATFTLADGDASQMDAARGFSDDAQTVGGVLADVLE